MTTQPYLERLSLRLSDSLGDVVADYTADGNTIKAIQREEAINRAVTLLYNTKLDAISLDIGKAAEPFMEKYLEYKHIKTYTRTPPQSTNNFTKDENVRYIVNIRVNLEKIAYPLKGVQYLEALTNKYSNYKPGLESPKFNEYKTYFTLELGGTIMQSGILEVLCLLEPLYTVFNMTGNDILGADKWEDEIIELSKAIVLGSHQF